MAKIPIILEPGRADGKLIKTNSIYDDNQEKFLSDKIKEIDDNHNTLKDNVNILTEVVNNNEFDIETKLETEKTRATNAENNLRETINNITDTNEHAATEFTESVAEALTKLELRSSLGTITDTKTNTSTSNYYWIVSPYKVNNVVTSGINIISDFIYTTVDYKGTTYHCYRLNSPSSIDTFTFTIS